MATVKKQALGRGLSALLPERPQFGEEGANEQVVYLAIDRLIADPSQPRRNFDAEKLSELADSIRQFGVMQPLLVTDTVEGDYRIVAGERRLRAAQLAELSELPCIIRTYQDKELAEISLIENIQREDLTALEEASAYRRLLDSFGYTQEALASRLGKSRPHIANTLRLLQLAPQYRKLLEEGKLTAGHARAVLSLPDPRLQGRLAEAIVNRGLSVRQAEELAKSLGKVKKAHASASDTPYTAYIHDLEKRFTNQLGLPVKMIGSPGRGKLVISYRSSDDLANLIERLLGELVSR
jgi:ParB family transcriptional regulator, chromosome partitioning protein